MLDRPKVMQIAMIWLLREQLLPHSEPASNIVSKSIAYSQIYFIKNHSNFWKNIVEPISKNLRWCYEHFLQ